MALAITKISDTFSTSPQITADDIAEIAALGFKTIINNRPDNEGGAEQPRSVSIQSAAEKAGLVYLHIPVIPGNITESNVAACTQFLANAPTPILGFCRTGNRASNLYQKARAQSSAGGTSAAKQNWLMQKITYFFQNKCLMTKLVRKLKSQH